MAIDCCDPAPGAAVALFRSLGDPARLAIVMRLAQGEARVVDLTRGLGLAQSTVSKHLACLRGCRLVGSRAEGRQSFYSLTHPRADRPVAQRGGPAGPHRGRGRPVPCLRGATGGGRAGVVSTPTSAPARRAVLRRRVRLLVAATIAYNVVEAVVAIGVGTVAGSIALIGFGLDSVIEVSSAAAVAWQFAGSDHERRERAALRVIAGSFFLLAAFVTVEALRTLVTGDEPGQSTVGIVLVSVSVVVMPFLSWAQRRAGRELGSASAVADSRQTLLCTYLSAGVLVGLVLNAALGWWWADPAVALGLAVVAVREGRAALRGDVCCAPVRPDDGPQDACGCAADCTGPCCKTGGAGG